MNRSPILLFALIGLLLLCLFSSISLIRSGQAQAAGAEGSGATGGLGDRAIPQTGQGADETPQPGGATPGVDETPDVEGTPDDDQTPQVTSESGMGQEMGETSTPTRQPAVTQTRERPTLRPSSTPAATNTPIPTFTLAPTRAVTPTVSGQAYQTAIIQQTQTCNAALTTFDEFAQSVTTDPTLLLVPDTRTRLDQNLAEINDTCGQLGALEPVPAEYAEVDQSLDRAAEEYRQMTDSFTRGLNTLDPTLFAQALDHLEAGTALANQATDQLP